MPSFDDDPPEPIWPPVGGSSGGGGESPGSQPQSRARLAQPQRDRTNTEKNPSPTTNIPN